MSSAKDKVLRVITIRATTAIIIAFIACMLGASYCVRCFIHSVFLLYFTVKKTEAHHFRISPDRVTLILSIFLTERMNEGAFSNEENNSNLRGTKLIQLFAFQLGNLIRMSIMGNTISKLIVMFIAEKGMDLQKLSLMR